MEAVIYESTNGQVYDSFSESERLGGSSARTKPSAPVLEEFFQESGITGFSRLPSRLPVDLQFENVTFTAPLGFRKGLSQCLRFVVINHMAEV